MSNSTFAGNSADLAGGGIANLGTLTVSNSTFAGNSADYGAGIYSDARMLTVSNSTFSGNSAFNQGGGIYNYSGTLTVSNSTFAGNGATDFGGGIYNYSGALTVSNSTFAGNGATDFGGGILNDSGTLTVSNSTFAGNRPPQAAASTASAAWWRCETRLSPTAAGGNCGGTITDGGHNLSYPVDGTCPAFMHGDPRLGPLQDNGGSTQTMTLGSGSAARDAGDDAICAAAPVNGLDQRGVARPQGAHCDIGAYEAKPPVYLPLIRR